LATLALLLGLVTLTFFKALVVILRSFGGEGKLTVSPLMSNVGREDLDLVSADNKGDGLADIDTSSEVLAIVVEMAEVEVAGVGAEVAGVVVLEVVPLALEETVTVLLAEVATVSLAEVAFVSLAKVVTVSLAKVATVSLTEEVIVALAEALLVSLDKDVVVLVVTLDEDVVVLVASLDVGLPVADDARLLFMAAQKLLDLI